jgi:hypothetical protein
MENSVRKLFLAALAVLSLSAAIVPAANADTSGATRMQQTGSYGQ